MTTATGPRVVVQTSGDVERLPAPLGSALFRAAQEAVTNARRHAVDPTVVAVDLAGTARRCGCGSTTTGGRPRRPRTTGQPLLRPGRHARALLARWAGEVRAGPDPAGGWTVEAIVPATAEAEGTRCMTTTAPVRVLIADDQDMVRVGLATILDADPSIDVVGQARDGLEAVHLVRSLRPDVCLFDIRMPDLDGIEATRRVAGPEVEDPVPVIVITTFDQDEYVYDALRAGARGFLLKDADPELLARAVRSAAQGDALIAPAVTARLLATFASSRARRSSRAGRRADPSRGGRPRPGRRRPHQRRDRRGAPPLAEHRQDPHRRADDQARRHATGSSS